MERECGKMWALMGLLLLNSVTDVSSLSLTVSKLECVYELVNSEGDKISGNFVVVDHQIFWSADHPGIDFSVTAPGGMIIYTEKGTTGNKIEQMRTHILTLIGDDQHRLNPDLIGALLSLLSQVKAQATSGSALVTQSQGRFFSNGFDTEWAHAAGTERGAMEGAHSMVDSFKPVVVALLTLPMPTFAAITGHAVGAGLAFALSHGYVIMRRDRGVFYMPEMDLGLTLPGYFYAFFTEKIGDASVQRDLLLRGLKMKGDEAEKRGLVAAAYGGKGEVREASVRLAEELAEREWDGEVYAEIRKALFPELCGITGLSYKLFGNARL